MEKSLRLVLICVVTPEMRRSEKIWFGISVVVDKLVEKAWNQQEQLFEGFRDEQSFQTSSN